MPDSDNPASIIQYIKNNRDAMALRHLPRIDSLVARIQTRQRQNKPVEQELETLTTLALQAAEEVSTRSAINLHLHYPPDLPVSQHADEIRAAISDHSVVIIAGETGSGKTTQIPKMLLELGFGRRGIIGHTQPRRIAARSVAQRLGEELATSPSESLPDYPEARHAVGYKVRFTDKTRPDTRVALMTDGLLLAELRSDRMLSRYDALIIDEAHERSLNIDFLLGVLRDLIKKRPEFRVVITSATIEPQRFAEHFTIQNTPPPVIEVSGRGYPVEIRYHPLDEEKIEPDDEQSISTQIARGICHAADELAAEGPGDILVFLPGEREIREAAHALEKHGLRHTEILPLYARLSAKEQQRVFQPHHGRRIVLATNVAETSLTVPGIHYVIDSGLARINRYHPRSRLQKLDIEPISQASANQRAGRCGRVAPGVCIRLFSEEDFQARPAFTDPEIRRSNLASVVLRLADLKLGQPENFAFIDPPDPRQLASARKQLFELKAINEENRLTQIGRSIARIPIDPALSRMIIAAREHSDDTVVDTLIVTAFLSINDPRERPADKRGAADTAHKAFALADSDFASALYLWQQWHHTRRHLSNRKARRWASENFLNANRLMEWHDLVGQLRGVVDDLWRTRLPDFMPLAFEPAEKDQPLKPTAATQIRLDGMTQSILTGLLHHIGMRDPAPPKSYQQAVGDHRGKKRRQPTVYLGANNRRFYLFPGSHSVKAQPKWVVSAEIVETSRVYARINAPINPRWIEPLAKHLLNYEYNEPHWDARSGRVTAFETVKLFGLPIVQKRRVDFANINPLGAREIFIRRALVEGDFESQHAFWRHNQQLIQEIAEIEAKLRRPAFLVDDETVYGFYHDRLPADITDARKLAHYLKHHKKANETLKMQRDDLLAQQPDQRALTELPDFWQQGNLSLPLHYHFKPGSADDGVSLHIPLPAINQINVAKTTYLVPGLREEKIEQLIRSLPKSERRRFVPAPDFARACAERITPSEDKPLSEALACELTRMTGHPLNPAAFNPEALPLHLRMRFVLVDDAGNPIDDDRDLAQLKLRNTKRAQQAFNQRARHQLEEHQAQLWDFDSLPETLQVQSAGAKLKATPALVDQREYAEIRLFDDPQQANLAHQAGVIRLLMNHRAQQIRSLEQKLRKDRALDPLRLHHSRLKTSRSQPREDFIFTNRADRALDEQIIARAIWQLALANQPAVRDQATFEARLSLLDNLESEVEQITHQVITVLKAHHDLSRRIKKRLPLSLIEAAGEIGDQMALLIHPKWVWHTPPTRFALLPTVLEAADKRLEKTERNPERDRMLRVAFSPLFARVQKAAGRKQPSLPLFYQIEAIITAMEQHRLSVFTEELSQKGAPKAKEIEAMLDALPAE